MNRVLKCFECWQIIDRAKFSRHESSIKAKETQIKRQERSGSVVVVLLEITESQRKRFDRNESV